MTTHFLERRQRQQQRERQQERERERERELLRELEQERREWDRQRQREQQQDWEEVQEWEREKERERERLLQIIAAVVKEASKRPEPVTRDLESQHENSGDLCVVCLEEKYSMVFVPCRHMCCCITCSSKVKTCPLCRKPINQVLKIFRH